VGERARKGEVDRERSTQMWSSRGVCMCVWKRAGERGKEIERETERETER